MSPSDELLYWKGVIAFVAEFSDAFSNIRVNHQPFVGAVMFCRLALKRQLGELYDTIETHQLVKLTSDDDPGLPELKALVEAERALHET